MNIEQAQCKKEETKNTALEVSSGEIIFHLLLFFYQVKTTT